MRLGLFLAPEGRQGCCGIAAGGIRRVSSNGKVRFEFTWPATFHSCTVNEGRECIDAAWPKGGRVVVGVGAPGQGKRRKEELRRRLALVAVRIGDHRSRRSAGSQMAGISESNSSGIALTSLCSSPWMSSAGSVGSGFGFEVSFVPSQRTRYLARFVPGAYDDIWGDLQRCTSFRGLSPLQMVSMYEQMVCHVFYGVARLGGSTFDFEAWRPVVSAEETLNVASHECNWDLGPNAGQSYLGHIVQWSGDPNSQKTAWLVVRSGSSAVRNWIPSAKIYNCLKRTGTPGPDSLAHSFLDRYLPDATGVWVSEAAACGNPSGASPVPPPSPGSPAVTWSEQQGSLGANTFLNPYNASGIGTKIQPYQWVAVSCKVYAPQIVSANPDGYWYRIASPPWNNAYYAVANTFWNGDIPGVKPYTHNTDFAVPDC
jgi:hypothetical protein